MDERHTEGDEERRTDSDSRKRIDDLREELVGKLNIAFVGLIIGGLFLAASVALTLYLNNHRIDELNRERYRNTVTNCEDINRRHDNTVRAVNSLYDSNPVQTKELRERKAATILLVDLLVPKRECEEVARRQIGR